MLYLDDLTGAVCGAAIEVHKQLGPGLLESAYEHCLCYELSIRDIGYQRQVPLQVEYKDVSVDCGYLMDILVEDLIVLELKSVDCISPVHEAHLLTYPKTQPQESRFALEFQRRTHEERNHSTRVVTLA